MTATSLAPFPPISGRASWRGAGLAWAVSAASVAALVLLSRPYEGLGHDARLYAGRVLADRDPGGVGRDLMFALDGQFGYTVFPAVLGFLADAIGLDRAGMALAGAGLVAWFVALAALAAHFARGRALWAALAFAAVGPAGYASLGLLHVGEAFATPRPWAEAGVLAALAAGLSGRWLVAAACLAAAALLHPIMALAGVAALFVIACHGDRRWLAAPLAAGAVLLVAALLGLPLAARLLTPIEATWRQILDTNFYLFPSAWPPEAWAPTAAHAATLAFMALNATGRVRALFAAALVTGLGGVAASLLLGDGLSLALVVQAQPWRALWLMCALALATLPLCLLTLCRGGPLARVAVPALAIAWLAADTPAVALAAAAAALGLAFLDGRSTVAVRPAFIAAAWAAAAAIALCEAWPKIAFLSGGVVPPEVGLRLPVLWRTGLPGAVLMGVLLAWFVRDWRIPPRVGAAAALLGLGAALATWDQRLPLDSSLDGGRPDPALVELLAAEPGEVLWIGRTRQAWVWAGRPVWAGRGQAASIVFSPSLARAWASRMDRLVELGLATARDRAPHGAPENASKLNPGRDGFVRLCAAPDGPAWILAPENGVVVPAALVDARWRAPAPEGELLLGETGPVWRWTQDYAVVGCARHRAAFAAAGLPPDGAGGGPEAPGSGP